MRHCIAWPYARISSLQRHAAVGFADRRAAGDQDLRLHEIDAGDVLGHRVFDLNARIDLDEIELPGVDVFEKFDGAGVLIADGATDRERIAVQLVAARLGQEQRRRALDDLLMAPLHGAVAFEQMHQIAVRIGEDLHFDVARALHGLFEIHLVVAERGLRFVARGRQQIVEQFGASAPRACRARRRPNSPSPSTESRSPPRACARAPRRAAAARSPAHTGTATLCRQRACGHFVAERLHHVRRRTDPDQTGREHVARELRVAPREIRNPDAPRRNSPARRCAAGRRHRDTPAPASCPCRPGTPRPL